jgi:hypothetical protein
VIELMMLPAGVTKGAGLLKDSAIGAFRSTTQSASAAPIDYSLLDVWEIGVAICGAAGQGKSYLTGLNLRAGFWNPAGALGDAGWCGVPWSRVVNASRISQRFRCGRPYAPSAVCALRRAQFSRRRKGSLGSAGVMCTRTSTQ